MNYQEKKAKRQNDADEFHINLGKSNKVIHNSSSTCAALMEKIDNSRELD